MSVKENLENPMYYNIVARLIRKSSFEHIIYSFVIGLEFSESSISFLLAWNLFPKLLKEYLEEKYLFEEGNLTNYYY